MPKDNPEVECPCFECGSFHPKSRLVWFEGGVRAGMVTIVSICADCILEACSKLDANIRH